MVLQCHAGPAGSILRKMPLKKGRFGKDVGLGRPSGWQMKVRAAGKGFGPVPAKGRRQKGEKVGNENEGVVGNGVWDDRVQNDDEDDDPHGVYRIVDLLPKGARKELVGHERLQEV